MKKGEQHPSAIRSKEWITESLLALMEKKDYQDITITEICNNAQLARRTFYRNYESKNEVVSQLIKSIIQKFTECMKNIPVTNFKNYATKYFDFWYEYLDTLTLFYKNGIMDLVAKEYIMESTKELNATAFTNPQILVEEEHYLLAFNFGGLWSTLTYWVSHDNSKSPEEIVTLLINQLSVA